MGNNVVLKDGREMVVDKRVGDYYLLPSGGTLRTDKVRTVLPNRNNIHSPELLQFKHNLRGNRRG